MGVVNTSAISSATERVARLQRLLAEAYEHYFLYDRAALPDEGSVTIAWPAVRAILDGDAEPSVRITSLAYGDGTTHVFDTLDDALVEVERWHSREMTNEPDTDAWFKDVEEWN